MRRSWTCSRPPGRWTQRRRGSARRWRARKRSWASATAVCLVTALALFAGAQEGGKKKVRIGDNVYLEIDGKRRRVLVDAYVCLRQGQLEQLVTRKRTKEHEAILAADVDARNIHLAL